MFWPTAVAFRTEWSTPGTIQMPRIGYEQEQLVSAGLGESAPWSVFSRPGFGCEVKGQPDTNRTDQRQHAIVSDTCHLLPKVRGERILCTEQICYRRSRMTDVILILLVVLLYAL